ncbi:hypothetical protein [Prescottella agglutinans]|uniref:Uncharacterized protein n=1 Tax=Prescottella agglutinans TaxID=1644129 RepID=A0ABT6MEY5_9NOCA|nr:hypothetical protein [Prescottella agglutinans]MDH6282832.1 hypothetical protein [Prescottella agglutinans]
MSTNAAHDRLHELVSTQSTEVLLESLRQLGRTAESASQDEIVVGTWIFGELTERHRDQIDLDRLDYDMYQRGMSDADAIESQIA